MNQVNLHIEPAILNWAISRANKSIDDFPRAKEWIEGTQQPTLKGLEAFANKFYVPLGYLFLNKPPREKCPIPFFRSIHDTKENLNVYDTVREIQDRQEWLSSYLRTIDYDCPTFIGKYSIRKGVQKVKHAIHQILNLSDDWAFQFKTVQEALNYLTKIIEDSGIMVSYNSVVGLNNYRHISVENCRGFSLVDPYVPFIFINNSDAKGAQMFTLIHEFAHVLLGYSAGIGLDLPSNSSITERFCDSVAAAFLVPDILLREKWKEVSENYEVLSKKFKVTRFVIARRAMEMGLISNEHLFYLYKKWKEVPINTKTRKDSGNFYATAVKRIGRTFLIHVNNAVNENKLLHMDAYHLTGLKGDTFHKLVESKGL